MKCNFQYQLNKAGNIHGSHLLQCLEMSLWIVDISISIIKNTLFQTVNYDLQKIVTSLEEIVETSAIFDDKVLNIVRSFHRLHCGFSYIAGVWLRVLFPKISSICAVYISMPQILNSLTIESIFHGTIYLHTTVLQKCHCHITFYQNFDKCKWKNISQTVCSPRNSDHNNNTVRISKFFEQNFQKCIFDYSVASAATTRAVRKIEQCACDFCQSFQNSIFKIYICIYPYIYIYTSI